MSDVLAESPYTRRRFLQGSGAALLASTSVSGMAMAAAPGPDADREPLRELEYADVQLTGGPFKQHYDAMHAHYLALSNDRLLKVYRQRAGLPAPGRDMGGWYDTDGFVPGHTLGQYISGLARIGASTGDAACHQKVHDLVTGFAATLGPENQSILRPKTNLWVCYTLDKHFAGLIDSARLSGVSESRDLLSRVLAGAQPLLPAKGRDRIGKKDPPYDETFVMPENLFSAAELTGNPAFRELAMRYLLDREYFDPLSRGEDPLPGQHAYSHAIALSSAGRAYLTLGEPKYRQAMQRAFRLLTTEQQFSSGGWGPNETFITPHKGELHKSLSSTVDHFETPCGAYAATKLARYLLRTGIPQDTQHGDNLERVLFNTILAVRSPDSDGDYPYYSTYSPDATKVYYGKKWPCCSGTLVQTVADYPLNAYFYAPTHRTVYVNLYTPSQARVNVGGTSATISQETMYPAEDTSVIIVSPSAPSAFTLRLRIPQWIARPATITVNGKLHSTAPGGSFAEVRRRWQSGDRVLVNMPQDFRTEAIDDQHPDVVALMRGPVQYVALNPGREPGGDRLPLPSSLKPLARGSQSFASETGGRQIVFVPLYSIQSESYTTYFSRA